MCASAHDHMRAKLEALRIKNDRSRSGGRRPVEETKQFNTTTMSKSHDVIIRKYPRCIATISAGFEKGDFLVREEKGQRVYFDFFEEASFTPGSATSQSTACLTNRVPVTGVQLLCSEGLFANAEG